MPASPNSSPLRALRRFTLGLLPGRSALARGSDRVEVAARLLLTLLVLTSVPVATGGSPRSPRPPGRSPAAPSSW
ncbi:hypothetical protein DQ238_02480 [Geodermatophilus sp. TF02-6]|uniref:hypothetical protein n=1 Tax=Geodermatophilus sp. TF02-6 TaxID=2250575 RepID=UPI000DE973E3|nr:hypothetical protein [Geodermatophilus sp. TF02-6]RBY82893.1 hypothetical protein DQ238_02480 [Geodermatophilus sp. TF02-6]